MGANITGWRRLDGLYRGKVIKHLPHGRLKVFIPGVYPEQSEQNPDMLPDAEQLTPLFGGTCFGNGVFSYPNIGSVVVCQFFNGDQNYPIVVGATLGSGQAKSKYGEVANELDEKTGKEPSCIHMICAGKVKVKLYEGGMIETTVSGSHGQSQITQDNEGNVFIMCDHTLQIQAEDVKIIARNRIDANTKDVTVSTTGQTSVFSGSIQLDAGDDGTILTKSRTNPAGKMI